MPNRCYCAPLGNCSGGISREHFMSHTLLRMLSRGETVRVEGFAAINGGEAKHLGPNALAANILCRHHNSLLADLDTTALKFFSLLRHETPEMQAEIDGLRLERWYLKLLLGLLTVTKPEFAPPVEWLEMVVGSRQVPAEVGLCFQFAGENIREYYDGFSVGVSFADPEQTQPCGVSLSFCGTSAYLMLDPEVGPDGMGLSLKPAFVSVAYPDRVKIAWLPWQAPGPGAQTVHPGPPA